MNEQASFEHLVFALSTSCLQYLGYSTQEGEATTPPGPAEKAMAQHSLDLLKMLKQKTNGNLSDQESQLLTEILTDLSKKISSIAT